MKPYAGLRMHRRSRTTGTRVSVYNSAEAKVDAGGDAWCVVCEDHGVRFGIPSRRLAEYHLGDPTLWCGRCQEVATVPRVAATFRRLRGEVCAADPDFDVVLDVDAAAGEPTARQFAYCEPVTPARIAVARKLDGETIDRIEAVLRHEFGHAVLFFAGRSKHTEREADGAAERLWGDPIRYDADDVQTLGAGEYPRPARLG